MARNVKGHTRLPQGVAGFNRLFRMYKYGAKRRSISFELTEKQFKLLTSDYCHYCGANPSQSIVDTGRRKLPETLEWGKYIFNGIDRKNNEEGYTLQNSLTCCGMCNKLKGTYSYITFLNKVKQIGMKHG